MIIGIGGVSMAGKSTLARFIKSQLSGKKVCILCQDDFIIPQKQIPVINEKTDWEHPASIDFDEYIATIVARNIEFEIVIAEGLFAYYDSTLSKLYDKKIFIDIPKSVFLDRKRLDKRWGIEPEWYIQHIWNSYLKYGTHPNNQADGLIVDGAIPIDIDGLLKYITK